MKIRYLKEKLWVSAAILAGVGLLYILQISCPIRALLGIPCPGCGMTRALLCLLRLDFAAAFSYHKMFWSVPLLYLCFLCDGRLFPQKWQNALLYSLLAAGFLINWIGALL